MNSLPDPGGALKLVLGRHLKGSKLLLESLDQPLAALAEHCRTCSPPTISLKNLSGKPTSNGGGRRMSGLTSIGRRSSKSQ